MSISIDKLIEEKTLLQKDFDQLSKKIKQVEIEVVQMRANMNACLLYTSQSPRDLSESRVAASS